MRMLQWIYQRLRLNPILALVIGALSAWTVERVANHLLEVRGAVVLLMAVTATVLIAALFDWIARTISRWRWRKPRRIFRGPSPEKRRGLIFLYSREETFWKAVEHHRDTLEYIWLVVTPQVKAVAGELQMQFEQVEMFTADVTSAWSPEEVAGAVERALIHAESLRLQPSDLICDVTGGTKAMTVGAVAACDRAGLALEMVPGQYDAVLNVQRPLEVLHLQV